MKSEILSELGARPSSSEEHGLSLLTDTDLLVFSPGISTAGFAEIRMVRQNRNRKVIATTIDEQGLKFAQEIINETGLGDRVEAKLEDLRGNWEYPKNFFDFIYARLVLHYLSRQDSNKILKEFHESLKPNGKLFVVVRSIKNIDKNDRNIKFDDKTNLTFIPSYDSNGNLTGGYSRYFHTPESITLDLTEAGFKNVKIDEYQEQLYVDFMRKEISPIKDHVIEVLAQK